MKFISTVFLMLLVLSACTSSNPKTPGPVDEHGQLSIKGAQLVNSNKQSISLSGPSFFWSNTGWGGEKFYHAKAVSYFKNDWHANIIRVAIGVEPQGGYIESPEKNFNRASKLIDAAIDQGLYVIVDWHSHHAEDYPKQAKAFFTRIARQYGEQPNLIYEIYNEPLKKTDWENTVKPYAIEVIKTIRAIDPDNIIVVGTQSWAQDVDIAAQKPITGFDNIAYALHFYAGTHKSKLRKKAETAIQMGLPLMVTEWGSVNADGDGGVDYQSVDEWLTFMRKHQLSHLVWAVNKKNESASFFKKGTAPKASWSDNDLTESGLLAKKVIREWNKQK